jgi:hypothetical protein
MEAEPWPNNLEEKRDDNGNMMGTYWEPIGKFLKQGKFPPPHPFQTPKGKKHV